MDDRPCPRCGYDLGGEASTWEDACPLAGRCTECGLEFHWFELLSERFTPPRWHVECPHRPLLGQVFGTLIRSLRPTRFWEASRIERLRMFGRTARYAVYGSVLAVLLTGLVEYALWWVYDGIFGQWATSTWGRWTPSPRSNVSNPDWLDHLSDAITALQPLMWFEWSVEPTALGIRVPIPTASGVYHTFGDRDLMILLYVCLVPACYLLLPQTLGAARVRRVQLARAMLLGLPVCVFTYEAANAASVLCYLALFRGGWRNWSTAEYFYRGMVTWLVLLPATHWVWWSAVNRRFLRLEQPRLVTAAMVAIASLIALLVFTTMTDAGAIFLTPERTRWY